jgi:hypothetical protein
MHDDNDELDLKHLDNPDVPKPEAPETEEPAEPVTPEPDMPRAKPIVGRSAHPYRKWVILVLVFLAALAAAYWFGVHEAAAPGISLYKTKSNQTAPATTDSQLTLDTAKNYGNKYKDGILPVGDGKYDATTAKKNSVYVCSQYAQNLGQDQGGAGSRGPWFTSNNTEYDLSKKLQVKGSVSWNSSFTNTLSGNTRNIVTNDLPMHVTGIYPIRSSDPAYQYDRNPNTIKSQSLTYSLASSPTYSATPQCMGGEAGVMLTGVALFNGFDAGGRDAGAWEIQDSCSGHPQKEGEYHYHTLSSCIKDVSVKTVLGFALDGFPITGPQLGPENILTTDDLDACHGITSEIVLDGKTATMYHYVMTQDFPYSVSCFRATPASPPHQPGART